MDDTDEADAGLSTAGDNGPELNALDFGRLEATDEEVPLHVQPKHQSQHSHLHYSSRASPSPSAAIKLHKLKLARLSHLDDGTKAKISRSVQTSHVKSWLHAHGYVVKADKLHPAVARVIEEWFSLVDQDGSRTLEHNELLAALKAAQIPCSEATIKEMIGMMDMNKDGVIGWDEFEVFMTEEFAAGKSLLSGEYLLPSGTSLNFGVMIGKLKRNKLLRDIMEDPGRRNRWASIASNPDALGRELAVMQEAVEATSLTLEHLKRSEEARRGAGEGGGGGGGADAAAQSQSQLQSQLTAAALVRAAVEESRRAARAGEPVRSLADKLRAGVLTPPSPELQPRRDCFAALPPPPSPPPAEQPLLISPSLSPARTPRGRAACPDPTASPRTPAGSEGGASACSSLEPFMQMQMQQMQAHASTAIGGGDQTDQAQAMLRPYGGGAGSQDGGGGGGGSWRAGVPKLGVSASAPPPGSASALSYNVSAVARYLVSQQSSYVPPSLLLTPYGSAPLDGWAGQGPRDAAPEYKGSGSGALAASSPPPPTAYGSRRPCDAAALRLQKAATSPGPSPAAAVYGSRRPSDGPRYLTAGTVSSRAHASQSTRVISQVGLMARELRGAPGRFSAEPPGLPAAVLAATRGQWGSLNDGGGSGGGGSGGGGSGGSGSGGSGGSGGGGALADRSLSASVDGVALSSRSATVHGFASAPQRRGGGGGGAAVAAEASPLRGGGASSLPVLPQAGQLSQFIDSVYLTARKVESLAGGTAGAAGASVPGSAGGTATRLAEGGRAPPCGPLEAASMHAAAAAVAWASPDAPLLPPPPISPRGGDATASVTLSPRPSRPVAKNQSPAAAAAAAAAVQPDGGPAANAGAGGAAAAVAAADKALKPTSAVMRSRAGLAVTADGGGSGDGGGGSGGASTHAAASSAGRRPVPALWGSGGAPGSLAPALGYRSGPAAAAAAGRVGASGRDAPLASAALALAPAPVPAPPPLPGNALIGSWLSGSDGGEGQLSGGRGTAGGSRRSPPRGASPPSGAGGGGAARARGRNRGQAGRNGDNGSGGASGAAAVFRREDAVAALSAALLESLPSRDGGAGLPPSEQLPYGGAASPHTSLLNSSCSLPVAAPSLEGRTTAGGSGRGAGGSPGRAALASIGPPEASPSPPSRGRGALAVRGEKEDATGDPSWQAAAASLLQMHISKQLSVT